MREANRLLDAGLLRQERTGNTRLLAACMTTPVYRPLTDLLLVTYGPLPVLSQLLARVPGIKAAYIYGSWAARYHQEPGGPPNDVDVLVIGTADRDELYDVAEEATRTLGREVNIRMVTPAAWKANGKDPFLASVRERPRVELDLARETAAQ